MNQGIFCIERNRKKFLIVTLKLLLKWEPPNGYVRLLLEGKITCCNSNIQKFLFE